MSRKARSARGDVIDFDLLAIKEQLATAPIPVGVDQRRKFIDEKGGLKTRQVMAAPAPALPSALMMAAEAAAKSAAASQNPPPTLDAEVAED